MMESAFNCLEIGASREEADLTVILMHGLGADAEDFADVAFYLSKTAEAQWRFVLPNAPKLSVTVNMGMRMPAWYDILDMSHPRDVNWQTVQDSQDGIEALLHQEVAKKRILAGFSQGGAMALHVGLRNQSEISGIVAMSGYLLESEAHQCPENEAEVPVALLHGELDPVVPLPAAQQALKSLKNKSYAASLTTYPGLEHSVSETEIEDLRKWLQTC